jgi:hypothetical protein
LDSKVKHLRVMVLVRKPHPCIETMNKKRLSLTTVYQPETRNPKPQTQNPKPESWNNSL